MQTSERRDEFVATLFQQYQRTVEHLCLRMVHYNPELQELVDNCVQDVFIAASKACPKLYDHPNLPGWIINTTKNCMKAELRKNKARVIKVEDSNLTPDEAIDSIERWHTKLQFDETVEQIHSSLTLKESAVFDLFFLENHKIAEIASSQKMSVSATTSAIYRIREKLKRTIRNISSVFFFCA